MNDLIIDLTEDFKFQNTNGCLTQLVHSGYKQVNVVESHAGTSRGGHYHRESKEAFYVVKGSVVVTASMGDRGCEKTYSRGDFFLINLNVLHSLFFPEDCIMVALYDKPIEKENGEKDIHTD